MTRYLIGAAMAVIAGVAIAAGVVYSGAVAIGADEPHSAFVFDLLETARDRAIERSAEHLAAPADLASTERIRRGAGNYEAMCATCHLRPGQSDSEIRKGLYPAPPALTSPEHADEHAPAEQFWVIKHGIKSTGMAAWGRGGMNDADIWDLVAFIRTLPRLGGEAYRTAVAGSDGHAHGPGERDRHGTDRHR